MARDLTEKQAVLRLQTYLRQLSLTDDSLPELPLDGIFASETRTALEIFQQQNGLPVTGEADRETWDTLYAAYELSRQRHGEPFAVDIFYRTPTEDVIRQGAVGFHVEAIRYMLNEFSVYYENVPPLARGERYDEQTADAVTRFQAYTQLPQTGEVDILTWNRLARFHNEQMRTVNE